MANIILINWVKKDHGYYSKFKVHFLSKYIVPLFDRTIDIWIFAGAVNGKFPRPTNIVEMLRYPLI